jgi:hypothetical protein
MAVNFSRPNRISAENLDTPHSVAFTRALGNILSTEIAQLTLAQILDGLPIADVAWDNMGTLNWLGHPVNSHKQLCEDALGELSEFQRQLKPTALKFDAVYVLSISYEYKSSATRTLEALAVVPRR